VGLDYKNPYLSPYQEFQRLKHHKVFSDVLEGGSCVYYGARTLNEGGIQSVPTLTFPGGMLAGCSAGFLNVPKVKGSHTAMKTGMLAAETIYDNIVIQGHEGQANLTGFEDAVKGSWVWEELHEVRNIRPSYRYGLLPFLAYSAIDVYMFNGNAPWTFPHHEPDHESLEHKYLAKKIDYPKPDGKISFDLLTNLARSGTNHEGDQPVHLRLLDDSVPAKVNMKLYDGPEGRFCPARVYEYVEDDAGQPQLVINAQNCLHCKACDIKDPTQNIDWSVPEGGGGPAYSGM